MKTLIASDDVTDAIVQIEMHRMEMQKETGAIGAGNEALRRLHEKNEYRCPAGHSLIYRYTNLEAGLRTHAYWSSHC